MERKSILNNDLKFRSNLGHNTISFNRNKNKKLSIKKRNSISSFKYNSYIPKKLRYRNSSQVEDIRNDQMKTLVGFTKKRKNSIVFAQNLLKNKIRESLILQKDIINSNNNDSPKNLDNSYHRENLSDININNLDNSDTNISNKQKNKNDDKNRRIFRRKVLYDSLEDSEEINDIKEENFYISPESNFILFLDFLIILCLNICTIYIPLKISYYKNQCIHIFSFDKYCFYSIDFIFFIDLLISFLRGYYNNQFNLVTSNKKIIKKYLATNFIYDFISVIPFLSFLVYYFENICFPYNINNNKHVLIVLSFCIKLFKYKKVRNGNKFMENITEFFSKNYLSGQIFIRVKKILKYCTVIHLMVCIHIFIGYHFNSSWLVTIQEKHNTYNYASFYICSFYFLITTLTTVGYGDIVCISLTERIFQILELSLGIVLYSYIISKLGDMIKRESSAKMEYHNNLAILEDIRITYPKIPYKLYNKILVYLQTNAYKHKKKI